MADKLLDWGQMCGACLFIQLVSAHSLFKWAMYDTVELIEFGKLYAPYLCKV